MRKYPRNAEWNAETAIRKMSKEAQVTSDSVDPLHVYEYSDGEETFYDVRGGLGDYYGLTFDELEGLLEADFYGMQEYLKEEYAKQPAEEQEDWIEENKEDLMTWEVLKCLK